MTEPKWKTPEYVRTGWICIVLFLLVVGVDIFLAIAKWPTISNYVSRRAEDQLLFGIIVFVVLVFLIVHFLKRWFDKWILKKK